MNIPIGNTGRSTLTTTPAHAATALGSGSVADTFGTPALLALLEAAAVAAIDHLLDEGYASVGVAADITHLAATPIGNRVTATATVTGVEGRKVSFRVEAHDEHELIGQGRHERVIINRARFATRLAGKR